MQRRRTARMSPTRVRPRPTASLGCRVVYRRTCSHTMRSRNGCRRMRHRHRQPWVGPRDEATFQILCARENGLRPHRGAGTCGHSGVHGESRCPRAATGPRGHFGRGGGDERVRHGESDADRARCSPDRATLAGSTARRFFLDRVRRVQRLMLGVLIRAQRRRRSGTPRPTAGRPMRCLSVAASRGAHACASLLKKT